MPDKITIVDTSGGPLTLIDRGEGWIYILAESHPTVGHLLLDLSLEDNPDIAVTDGTPRLIVHSADHEDMLVCLRFHPHSLLLDTESGVNEREEGASRRYYYHTDSFYQHRMKQTA